MGTVAGDFTHSTLSLTRGLTSPHTALGRMHGRRGPLALPVARTGGVAERGDERREGGALAGRRRCARRQLWKGFFTCDNGRRGGVAFSRDLFHFMALSSTTKCNATIYCDIAAPH